MIPKKPAPDVIRGGNRFSEKIMLKQKIEPIPIQSEHATYAACILMSFLRSRWRTKRLSE